jgi:peptidoglycan/xylan/chitin deacetylase (PgdA/CDA1 family)
MGCERHLLATLGRRSAELRSRILCYHSVGTPQWGVNDVSPAQFRRHIELALAAGYRFVAADEIARTGGQPGELAITFDDGLTSVATNAAPILAEYGIPWTLFVVANWADGRHDFGDGLLLGWREIEKLAAQGATIGSHSMTHPNFGQVSAEQTHHELGMSRWVIEARLGIAPTTFAIPFGQSKNWRDDSAAAARDAGYTQVYAQAEETRPNGTIPRTFVTGWDDARIFRAALGGAFDRWEEWV